MGGMRMRAQGRGTDCAKMKVASDLRKVKESNFPLGDVEEFVKDLFSSFHQQNLQRIKRLQILLGTLKSFKEILIKTSADCN
jgi:hypothetical protein